jgi:hypothetical protein
MVATHGITLHPTLLVIFYLSIILFYFIFFQILDLFLVLERVVNMVLFVLQTLGRTHLENRLIHG